MNGMLSGIQKTVAELQCHPLFRLDETQYDMLIEDLQEVGMSVKRLHERPPLFIMGCRVELK